MNRDPNKRLLPLLALLLFQLACSGALWAESKRIEVYTLSQNYWDTKSGDTLGEIAKSLLPHNPRMQHKLMTDIISLNPDAFTDNNPDQMKANTRLWLPGHLSQPDSKANPKTTRVESYSWGNIKRPK